MKDAGLAFAKIEHRWERRTNYALLLGILIVGFMYYYKMKYLPEVALFFLVLSGFFHLIARVGHSGEQYFFKKRRPWR